jgi:hypothetical protein
MGFNAELTHKNHLNKVKIDPQDHTDRVLTRVSGVILNILSIIDSTLLLFLFPLGQFPFVFHSNSFVRIYLFCSLVICFHRFFFVQCDLFIFAFNSSIASLPIENNRFLSAIRCRSSSSSLPSLFQRIVYLCGTRMNDWMVRFNNPK